MSATLSREAETPISSTGTTVTGWRYWRAEQSGTSAALVSPIRTVGQTSHDLTPLDEWASASCRHSGHRAPHKHCVCGFRVVTDLRQLIWYVRFLDKKIRTLALFRGVEHTSPAIAMGRIEGTGRIEPGSWDDPPGTVRAERIRVVGPLLLSPAAAQMADALQATAPCEVIRPDDELDSLRSWLASLVDLSDNAALTEFSAWRATIGMDRNGVIYRRG